MKHTLIILLFCLGFSQLACSQSSQKSDKIARSDYPSTNSENSFAIVQLFTSQGCSSCPPADRLLKVLNDESSTDDLIVLSYHVDYWNRLGWKDVFSSEKFTQKQYQYEGKFHYGSVYTPQAVVNGAEHTVGSQEDQMRKLIKKYENLDNKNELSISNVKVEGENLNFDLKFSRSLEGQNLMVAFVKNEQETSVKRGENGGSKLISTNIVLDEIAYKLDNEDQEISLKLNKNEIPFTDIIFYTHV